MMNMFDGIKLSSTIPSMEDWQSCTGIELDSKFNTSTGEQKQSRARKYKDGSRSYTYFGRYKDYLIEIIESQKIKGNVYRLNCRGSLHKNHTGNNHGRFTKCMIADELESLSKALYLDPSNVHLQNIEVGVNVKADRPVYPMLNKGLLIHKTKGFNSYNPDSKGVILGYKAMRSQFDVKIYDKAMQCKLDTPLMRFEVAYKKIAPINVKFDSLLFEESIERLYHHMISQWDAITLIDIDKYNDISEHVNKKWLLYSNPKYWESLSPRSLKYHRSCFTDFREKYDDHLHQKLKLAINNEWQYLKAS